MATRLKNNIERAERITLSINGNVVSAYAGETIATILLAENISVFYKTKNNQPRAPFCNMGTCFECQVKVNRENTDDSSTWARACMTLAEDDMVITTGGQICSVGTNNDED